MLTDEVARQLAETLTSKLKSTEGLDTKSTWTLIFSELFKSLKDNGVIEVKQLESIDVIGPSLVGTAGPVVGTISPPSMVRLKGKIT
jgi:hypothetical protein